MSKIHKLAVRGVVLAVAGLFSAVASVHAAEGLWQTDFKAAQAKAKARKESICWSTSPARTGAAGASSCTDEVFDKEPFKTEAPKQFVLVELDFPHDEETLRQN